MLCFSQYVMPDSVTPWTVAGQPPVSLGFPRQEYCSGVPFPSPGDLPDPGMEPASPALAGRFLTIEPPEKPKKVFSETQNSYKNSDLSLKKKSVLGFLVRPKWFSVFVVAQSLSHIWLCNPVDCRTPGFSVPHHLPEFAQVHVHCISDAIQPSHPVTPSSPSVLNLSQHQGLLQWVGCSCQVAKILELQHQSFQRVFRVDFP